MVENTQIILNTAYESTYAAVSVISFIKFLS